MTRTSHHSSVFNPFVRLMSNLETRRIARQLRSYDDFMLRDIGLTRGDVERASRLPVWALQNPLCQ